MSIGKVKMICGWSRFTIEEYNACHSDCCNRAMFENECDECKSICLALCRECHLCVSCLTRKQNESSQTLKSAILAPCAGSCSCWYCNLGDGGSECSFCNKRYCITCQKNYLKVRICQSPDCDNSICASCIGSLGSYCSIDCLQRKSKLKIQ